MPTSDTRHVLHRCIVAQYMLVPITLSEQLGCIVTFQQRLLQPRPKWKALVVEYYLLRPLAEREGGKGT